MIVKNHSVPFALSLVVSFTSKTQALTFNMNLLRKKLKNKRIDE